MTLKEMLEGLGEGLERSRFIFPKKDGTNLVYATFEIFAYLLFSLDFFMVMYQEQKLRIPLFNFIADNMLQTLDIERSTFNSTLHKSMEEYVGIQTDGQLTAHTRNEKLLRGFIDNLTYSISEQDLFQWEGRVKPLPFTGATEFLEMHIIFATGLMPVELKLWEVGKSIFAANPDFTKLSIQKINSILDSVK